MRLKLLSVNDVMELLQVSRDTIYRLAAIGEIPGRKIGRAWRFPSDEIEAYVRRRHQAAHGQVRIDRRRTPETTRQ